MSEECLTRKWVVPLEEGERNESLALPATLEISDTPANSGVVSSAAARLRFKLILELGGTEPHSGRSSSSEPNIRNYDKTSTAQ